MTSDWTLFACYQKPHRSRGHVIVITKKFRGKELVTWNRGVIDIQPVDLLNRYGCKDTARTHVYSQNNRTWQVCTRVHTIALAFLRAAQRRSNSNTHSQPLDSSTNNKATHTQYQTRVRNRHVFVRSITNKLFQKLPTFESAEKKVHWKGAK